MKPISITLDHETSEILTDAGGDAFLVIGRGSYPHSVGRWILYLVPASVKTIDAAVRVAAGSARAVKITNKPPKP